METMRTDLTTRQPRVLVVDRHPDTLTQLERLLTACGYDVRTADSCAAARASLHASDDVPHVVVSEIWLGDGDGVDLLRELKRACGCGTIAHTACGMADDVARCRAAGIDRHLLKPLGVRELPHLIATMAA